MLREQEQMGTQGFSLVVCRPEPTMLGSPESSREGRARAQGRSKAHLLSQDQICPPRDSTEHG